jgi:predicted alpha-1,6-mannanase (GH76 family)
MGVVFMPDWKVSAQNAVNALQQWYGASATGLYSWDPSDAEVIQEAGITDSGFNVGPARFDVVMVIKMVGLWDALRDTLRWWNTANAVTALIDYMLVTGDRSHLDVVDNTFTKGPNTWKPKSGINAGDYIKAATHAAIQWVANQANPTLPGGGHLVPGWADPGAVFIGDIAAFNTNFLDDFYDDDGWWALAWIKAYDVTNDKKYLSQAETIFQEMANGVDNVCKGGTYWQKNHEDTRGNKPYKNAIPNELFLAVAAALFVRTKDQSYLTSANTEWTWFSACGLINNSHLINDSLNTSCSNDGSTGVWTYNQGVILGALCELFLSTGQQPLLDKAQQIADALITQQMKGNISGVVNGILTEYNDSDTTAAVDNKQFKGIFIRNLGYLYKLRPLARYRAFILNNANSALAHMNSSNQFGGNWAASVDQADFVRQTSGLDLLNAANTVPPQINYDSLRQFMTASNASLYTRGATLSVKLFLNGVGPGVSSLRSVMLN